MPPTADDPTIGLEGLDCPRLTRASTAAGDKSLSATPWRTFVRAIMALYGRFALPVATRRFLREGLKRSLPGTFDWLSKTINSPPKLPIGGEAPRMADVIERPEIRVGIWRLVRTVRMHADQFGPVTHVIALPTFATGESATTAANFARTICADGKRSAIMIATDRPYNVHRLPAPPGALMLDLWEHFTLEDNYARDAVVFAILRAVAPQVIHIINSAACWRLVVRHGMRLRHFSRLYGSIFPFQANAHTRRYEGYAADHMRDALPHLDALISDNAICLKQAEGALGPLANAGKLVTDCNASPAWPDAVNRATDTRLASLAEALGPTDRLQVLWAGRLDREELPDLLIAAARARPNIDFHVYGAAIVDITTKVSPTDLANVHLHGPFLSAAAAVDARLHHVAMFTFFSEGTPNVLLEFGTLGVPIVANILGGVGELIDETTGYPLVSLPGVPDYLGAFDQVRVDRATAVARSHRLRAKIAGPYTRANFEAAVRRIPSYLPNLA